MAENAEWKAAMVGGEAADQIVGSWRARWRRGSEEREGRESMKEAAKAGPARVMRSGREMPPMEAGRRSWKAVRASVSRRRRSGRRRRMEARALAP